jgi:hypothetical protein
MSKKTTSYGLRATGVKVALAVIAVTSVSSAADLVDPTRPPAAARKAPLSSVSAPAEGPRVTAIIQTGDRRVAVFHGQVVKAGDRVGDMFIESVSAEGVRYRRAGRVEFARLPKQAAVVRRNIDSEESEP